MFTHLNINLLATNNISFIGFGSAIWKKKDTIPLLSAHDLALNT